MKSWYTKRTRRQGFTLLELLVVMFILVMLAGVVTVLVTKRIEQAKHARAVADVASFDTAIEHFQLDTGTLPATLDDLRSKPSSEDLPQWNGPYLKKAIPADPWGRPYNYAYPAELNPDAEANEDAYDLYSLGRDGKEGGSGSDADVTNWE